MRPPGSRTSSRMPIKPRTTSDQPSTVSGSGMSTGQKRKKGKNPAPIDEVEEQVPEFDTGTVHKAAWRRLRDTNPYRFKEKTCTDDEGLFWTETQGCLWEDFYNNAEHTKNGTFVQPKAINKEELLTRSATEYRFVIDTLKKMGLFDLVCLKPGDGTSAAGEYSPALIRQFHCTIYFHDDPARTMTWMTGTEKYSCNYLDFCEAMGFGAGRAQGFQIHSEEQFGHGHISFCYPPNPAHASPVISGMYYSYLVLAKMFRESLISKSGDAADCRAYHLNLMYYCRPENVTKIDGCDFLYNELKRSVRNRMTPNLAQYIQQLIDTVVPSPNNKKEPVIRMEPFKFPNRKNKPEIPELLPPELRSKTRHDTDAGASSSTSTRPQRGAARFFTNLWQMCRNSNDVAHRGLALNQETRRRQNEFMAERNHVVPPPGPEMEAVAAPNWEMPPIEDAMFQNFDFSLFAPSGSSRRVPSTRSRAAPPAASGSGSGSGSRNSGESGEEEEDEDEDEDQFY